MSAAGTVDEFVETLLQAKAALVGAVVDGEALEEAGVGDSVLEELQRLLARMSPQIADFGTGSLDTAQVSRLLRDLARDAAADRRATARGAGARPGQGSAGTQSEAMQAALRLLEQALAGAQVTRYRVASSSRPDQHYDLEVAAGGEVTCGCPGFGYRGQCSHGRSLKSALARRGTPPQGFTAVGMAPA